MRSTTDLKMQVAALKAEQPRLRQRDLAKALSVSELEILLLDLGEHVILLEGDWKSLLSRVKEMGYVMALSRNEYCVHERKGVYDNISFYEGPANVGVAVNPDIDLRFFMNEWVYAVAVVIPREKMDTLYAFQFFNRQGEAVHKIYSTNKSDLEAYHRIVADFRAGDQNPVPDIAPAEAPAVDESPDATIDVTAFQQAWKDLQDTHHFFGMLKKFGVTRTQALRLAPAGMTEQIDNEAVVRMLETAAADQVPIMCFVHSPGCVQIHTGPVNNLRFYGNWYNVLDASFNLHLDTTGIASTWIVRKPTADGVVTSLELFDRQGDLIVYFFGARKPGKPELPVWREVINQLGTGIETE